MSTVHPEGYRIPRGVRKSSAEGRLPFLPRSLQLFTTVTPLEPKSRLLPRRKRAACIVAPRGTNPSTHSEILGALEMNEDGKTVVSAPRVGVVSNFGLNRAIAQWCRLGPLR